MSAKKRLRPTDRQVQELLDLDTPDLVRRAVQSLRYLIAQAEKQLVQLHYATRHAYQEPQWAYHARENVALTARVKRELIEALLEAALATVERLEQVDEGVRYVCTSCGDHQPRSRQPKYCSRCRRESRKCEQYVDRRTWFRVDVDGTSIYLPEDEATDDIRAVASDIGCTRGGRDEEAANPRLTREAQLRCIELVIQRLQELRRAA
jgi:rubrerythrin